MTVLHKPAPPLSVWPATDDLPLGVPRNTPSGAMPVTGIPLSHGYMPHRLAIVAPITFTSEYARALANPHLYDETDLEHMHEMWLIANALTEWPCGRCDQTNLTPDREFSMASPCAFCSPYTPEAV